MPVRSASARRTGIGLGAPLHHCFDEKIRDRTWRDTGGRERDETNRMKRMILLLPVMAGIVFGAAGVFVRKLGGYGMSSPTILFLRVSFAVLALAAVILLEDRSRFRVKPKDFPLLLGSGLLGMLGLNLCYNEAINTLTLSLAAVLLSLSPVFVVVLAAFLFREKITRRKIACMILAILGCVLASGLLEQTSGLEISLGGILMGLAAALFYALYGIFSRQALDRGYHSYTVIFYSVLQVGLVLMPFAEYGKVGAYLAEDTLPHLLFLVVHALCTSVLPYVFLTVALRHAEAGTVSILAAGGEPIAAVVFGWIFYAEVPTAMMLLGMAVTIAALAFLCRQPDAGRQASEQE